MDIKNSFVVFELKIKKVLEGDLKPNKILDQIDKKIIFFRENNHFEKMIALKKQITEPDNVNERVAIKEFFGIVRENLITDLINLRVLHLFNDGQEQDIENLDSFIKLIDNCKNNKIDVYFIINFENIGNNNCFSFPWELLGTQEKFFQEYYNLFPIRVLTMNNLIYEKKIITDIDTLEVIVLDLRKNKEENKDNFDKIEKDIESFKKHNYKFEKIDDNQFQLYKSDTEKNGPRYLNITFAREINSSDLKSKLILKQYRILHMIIDEISDDEEENKMSINMPGGQIEVFKDDRPQTYFNNIDLDLLIIQQYNSNYPTKLFEDFVFWLNRSSKSKIANLCLLPNLQQKSKWENFINFFYDRLVEGDSLRKAFRYLEIHAYHELGSYPINCLNISATNSGIIDLKYNINRDKPDSFNSNIPNRHSINTKQDKTDIVEIYIEKLKKRGPGPLTKLRTYTYKAAEYLKDKDEEQLQIGREEFMRNPEAKEENMDEIFRNINNDPEKYKNLLTTEIYQLNSERSDGFQ